MKQVFYSNNAWRVCRFEPIPRLCGGVFGYVQHRFPIKGGISLRDIWVRQASRPNPLLKMVRDAA